MENSVNLKYLSLDSRKLKMLPKGLLPRFQYLQYVLLPFHIQVDVEEIESLKQLEMFSCRVKDVYDFNRIICDGNITSFAVVIDEYPTYLDLEPGPGVDVDYKRIVVSGRSLVEGEGNNNVSLLAHDIQHLQLHRCEGLSSCFSDDLQRLGSPRSIKTLLVSDCEDIECIVRLTTTQTQLMIMAQEELNSLEEIGLYDLPNLIGVIDVAMEPPPFGLFSSLKRLDIQRCHKIKKLGLGLLLDLQNLESIYVESCDEIEEIIQVADEGAGGIVSLPKIKWLCLFGLPKLKSICTDQEAKMCCNSIEEIYIRRCPKIKKLPLLFLHSADGQSYSLPPNLKNITIDEIEKEWWESLEWDHHTHKSILQPYLYLTPLQLY